jgi:hypothetical protein
LHIAAQAGALDSLKYVIDDLKLEIANNLNRYNMTALHSACKVNIYSFFSTSFKKVFILE